MKTIIFDMDGLMFDTEKMWLESFIEAGKEIGYDLTSEIHNKIMGTNKESQIRILKEILGDDFPHEKFYDIHRNFMNQITEKYGVEPKKGLEELLNYLVKNNYTLAIASSIATTSACRNALCSVSTILCVFAKISPFGEIITTPTGTSPISKAFSASAKAKFIYSNRFSKIKSLFSNFLSLYLYSIIKHFYFQRIYYLDLRLCFIIK